MLKGRLKWLRAALLAIGCVAMAGTPAWAGSCGRHCSCYCQGIDPSGCLTNSGGTSATIAVVLNTKKGTFTGSCRCRVRNSCRRSECYKNVCFISDPGYHCGSSVYTCQPCGSCCYTVCGTCGNGGESGPPS